MNLFLYDNGTNTLKINEYEILLIKEFKTLWTTERNKTESDLKGEYRLLAFKELTYIYLYLDWKSPYFQYLEQDKHEAALLDSGLSQSEFENEDFKAAFNKYSEIQESDRILSLIKTGHRTLLKTQVFLDNIDFNNDVDENGKPLYKPKDIIADIGAIAKMRNQLLELEIEHKKGLSGGSKFRAGAEPSYDDV